MEIKVIFENDDQKTITNNRTEKGKSIVLFPENYTVIDLETTGLYPRTDEIIEIAALKIRDGLIADTFNTLVKPDFSINGYVEYLTGITNDMVKDAPPISEALPKALDFIGNDIVVGHNVNFDVNFLYDNCELIFGKPFTNDFIDTMRIARRVLPDQKHHRLFDVADVFNIEIETYHRALCDCETTFKCFCVLKERASKKWTEDEFSKLFNHQRKDLREIKTQNNDFDETHPLFGKVCVFTGKLEKMLRVEAAQLVVNLGGFCENGVNMKTNFLILGNNDYCSSIKDGKSSKQKKAEKYKQEGFDIEIIPEDVFYELIEM